MLRIASAPKRIGVRWAPQNAINDLLTDEKELNTRYENLKKKIKATGGISLYDLTPAEIAVLEKKLGKTITGDVNTLFPKIETGLGVADDGSNGVLGTAFNDDKKLTLKMIDVLEEQKRQADASMPVLYKTLIFVAVAATGVVTAYVLVSAGAAETVAALITANGNGIIDKLAENVIRITVPSNGAGVVDIDNALVGVGTVATGLTISYEAWLAQLRESGYLNFSSSKNTGNSNKGKKDNETDSNKLKKPTSANQMNKQINKGQAPKGVVRVDNPDSIYAEPHVHFGDGTSITQSGKIHDRSHGTPHLTREILNWLHSNGWCLNIK